MSSNKLLLFVFIVVMAGLIGGIAYMSKHPKSSQQAQNPTLYQPLQSNPTSAISQQTPVIQGGSSNQELQQDTQSIDNSLNTINSELSNVDSGLNDQQTNLQ